MLWVHNGTFFEHPKYMFRLLGKKIITITILRSKKFLNRPYEGQYIHTLLVFALIVRLLAHCHRDKTTHFWDILQVPVSLGSSLSYITNL